MQGGCESGSYVCVCDADDSGAGGAATHVVTGVATLWRGVFELRWLESCVGRIVGDPVWC
jgi:hypothetical protein